MSLTDAQRARFARHLLLPELGEVGQQRLVASAVRPAPGGDQETWQVARNYLSRAGVAIHDQAAQAVHIASADDVARLAGQAALVTAARALAGAFAAVEAIKNLTGIGNPSELPELFSLASEEA